jgi:hypothetical protein
MPDHVRVCRECGEEYRPEIVRCADCGGELEDRYEGDGDDALPHPAPEPAAAAELAGYRVLFMTPRAADLVPLAERLRESALQYRLAEQPAATEGAPPRYALLVQDKDAAGALVALADLVAPHEDGAGVDVVETRFHPEHGYVACPACGAEAAPGAVECPDCGLGLAGGDGEAEIPQD